MALIQQDWECELFKMTLWTRDETIAMENPQLLALRQRVIDLGRIIKLAVGNNILTVEPVGNPQTTKEFIFLFTAFDGRTWEQNLLFNEVGKVFFSFLSSNRWDNEEAGMIRLVRQAISDLFYAGKCARIRFGVK